MCVYIYIYIYIHIHKFGRAAPHAALTTFDIVGVHIYIYT